MSSSFGGLSATEAVAVGLSMPENLKNDPVTKAVYDNVMGNLPTKKPKVSVFCKVCKLEFSSQVVLDTHLSGSKHQKKVKSQELLKSLETADGFERNPANGDIKCTICDVTVNSAQLMAAHIEGNKHKAKKNKRANGEEGGKPAKKQKPEKGATDGAVVAKDGADSTSVKANNETKPKKEKKQPPKKKERPPLNINIPACITKLEDNKSGGKFLCNPCAAHCNSDVQLSQHLSSAKHLDKESKFVPGQTETTTSATAKK